METVDFSRFILSFLFVVGLIVLCAVGARKWGRLQGMVAQKQGEARLKIVEYRMIDTKRKLVLVQRDDVQHLLLISPNSELLVESGITPKAEAE